jgi:hypothetical protein
MYPVLGIAPQYEGIMRLFVPRFLMLGCGLLLALPPGWCCILAIQTARQETTKLVPCCRSCCGNSNSSTPTPKPVPHKPGRCPCADRQTTAPENVKTFHCDLSIVAPLAALDPAPFEANAGEPAGLPPHLCSSAQLLHCVWLC